MNNFFDTHSHLNFSDFDDDRNEVIEKTLSAGGRMIIVGTCAKDSKVAVDIAGSRDAGVYASVGMHPTEKGEVFDTNYYRSLAKNNKVVAIGECGLDYFRDKGEEFKIGQRELFIKHIELALELDKPLIIHCREAHGDVFDILNRHRDPKLRGVIHFFSGDWPIAQKYFDLDFLISFAGVITFSRDYDGVIKKAPLDKILIETDSPFAAPVPCRGKRNEPIFVKEVAKKIAEIKNISNEEAMRTTCANAIRLFVRN